ncbi:MarR family winged helix-turn-helix transcriptional regulator [Streptomonospora wellingtoniae]|uniref:MarR family transcriptional regulator n=1 Tax=Streptomonospora wellingtoniae TaxID=3075544 RepID=A0ABU2KSV8_9ACTN|nr:MarR family transcriptional regulator [Streptomonospora sp. DSM 45055]MDT0302376.1 MarR family transcriptional regulator [Streptomonospora sp. DSM 45055]
MNSADDFGGVPGSTLWGNTGYRLIKLGEMVLSMTEAAFEPLGLNPRHFNVLATAAAMDAPSQQELSRRLGIDPNVMVGVVDDLESSGLAERRRNPDDRRRYIVVPTPRGRELLAECTEVVDRVEDRLFSGLDEDERAALHGIAGRLLAEHPAPVKRH